MNLEPIILAELRRGGPPIWAAGTYPRGAEVRSSANLRRYVRVTTGVSNADPSDDGAGWLPCDGDVLDAIATVNSAVGDARNDIAAVAAAVNATRSEIATQGVRVQSGTVSAPSGPPSTTAKYVDVVIAAVNPAKTTLSKLTDAPIGGGRYEVASQIKLLSSTVLRVTHSYKSSDGEWWWGGELVWEVAEWN